MTETASVSAPEAGPTTIGDLPTPSDHKPAAAAAAARPPPPSKTNLPALLKAVPSSADAFLSHLQRCLATPSGVDTLLLFVCYLSRFAGAALTRLSQTLLRRTARELVALALTLPPRTAIIFGTTTTAAAAGGKDAPARTAAARLAALLGQRLASLGSLASEARTIARLWSLVGLYFWGRRLAAQLFAGAPAGATTSTTTSSNRLATAVDWAQFVSCAMFQALENGAYLSGRGVLGWTPAEQGRAYVVGSRWLCVYTGLELGRLLAGLVSGGGGDVSGAGGEEEMKEERDRVEGLRRSMAINLAWAPLTLHWATEKGFLSDLAVGAGGCIPGVLQMRKLWRETA